VLPLLTGMHAVQSQDVQQGEAQAESGEDKEQQRPDRSEETKEGEDQMVQHHAERAEAGPDVHVDKEAGTISIARLPPGSR